MHRTARLAVLPLLALSLTGCSTTGGVDSEDLAWASGCGALSAGIQVQGVKREAQVEVLTGLVDSSGLSSTQRDWARQGISLLKYEDVRKAPKKLRNAAGAPCREHGHRIAALD